MTILTLCLFCAMSCASLRKAISPAPAIMAQDLKITALPDSTYKVTKAWMKERIRYELWLRQQLDDCKKNR